LKKLIKSYGLLALVASLVILLDQVTKAIVRANLPFGGSWAPFEGIASFFRIVNWENHGAAFGMFQGGGIIFGVLATIVSVIIIAYFPRIPREFVIMRIALAMQMGGAIGNLIDRLRFGPVTDFIAVGTFPVFNIADASITVGVAILLVFIWLEERKEKAENHTSDQAHQDRTETSLNGQS
jgi:signal peptidase II